MIVVRDAMKYQLPPFRERTLIEHVGRFFEALGAIMGLVGVLFAISLVWDLTHHVPLRWWKLYLGIPMVVVGILLVGLGEWIYTPRGQE